MSKNPLQLMKRRGSKIVVGVLAALLALVVVQPITPAAADSVLHASVSEQCPQDVPRACLWVDGRGGSGLMAMISSPDGKPDMLKMRMRGLTPQFTDNISVGYNGLPFDLCLYDSVTISNSLPVNRYRTRQWFVVPSGTSFAQLDDFNDIFDHYTTADPGGCPESVEYNSRTGEIFTGWSPS